MLNKKALLKFLPIFVMVISLPSYAQKSQFEITSPIENILDKNEITENKNSKFEPQNILIFEDSKTEEDIIDGTLLSPEELRVSNGHFDDEVKFFFIKEDIIENNKETNFERLAEFQNTSLIVSDEDTYVDDTTKIAYLASEDEILGTEGSFDISTHMDSKETKNFKDSAIAYNDKSTTVYAKEKGSSNIAKSDTFKTDKIINEDTSVLAYKEKSAITQNKDSKLIASKKENNFNKEGNFEISTNAHFSQIEKSEKRTVAAAAKIKKYPKINPKKQKAKKFISLMEAPKSDAHRELLEKEGTINKFRKISKRM